MNNKGELTMVRDFMDANDQNIRYSPVTELPEWEKLLRVKLILEEAYELAEALGIEVQGRPNLVCRTVTLDPVDTLDALTDIMYVTLGAYHTFGLAKAARDAFHEVHQSNMSKLGPDGRPIKDASGKVLKGPNYLPPNLAAVLDHHTKQPVIFDNAD